jgi:hypothetical protein
MIAFFILFFPIMAQAAPIPIQFGVPESKIVQEMPRKSKSFAFLIPGEMRTYIYDSETAYYEDYQKSYFAITRAKGGWDCLRHYEILANGCIPYFLNLDQCHPETMAFLPKELILEAMHLEGVSDRGIDYSRFNRKQYDEILNKLLEHTRKYLTTRSIANHLLNSVAYTGTGKILFLTNETTPDYLRCLTLIGLKEILQERIVDFPKIEHIYQSYPGDVKKLYGKGFTYTKIIEDLPIDREDIEQRIRQKEFDLIIYGSVHRGLRYHDLVKEIYQPQEILYLCGEDGHGMCEYWNWTNLFLREFN